MRRNSALLMSAADSSDIPFHIGQEDMFVPLKYETNET
jgi:hypothetical protein